MAKKLYDKTERCSDGNHPQACGNCVFDIKSYDLEDGRFQITITAISGHSEPDAATMIIMALKELAMTRVFSPNYAAKSPVAVDRSPDEYSSEVTEFIRTLGLGKK